MTDTHRISGNFSSIQPVLKKEDKEQQVASPTAAAISTEKQTDRDEDSEYISGMRLYTVLLSITLVMFLIMLDQTIVVTVYQSLPRTPFYSSPVGNSTYYRHLRFHQRC